jgi:endonuclease/exonuclease/phosphatase family metal-dependent hydrolase
LFDISARIRPAKVGLALCFALILTTVPIGSAGAVTITPIHDVQGAAHLSPLTGQSVTVQGIVTVKRTGTSQGFWIQEATADANDATSEAIFVLSTAVVTLGDLVEVTGTVTESRANTSDLTTTQLASTPSVAVQSTGNSLPAPVLLGTGGRIPPSSVIEDDSASDVDTANVFDPAQDGLDFYESLEGMRVTISNARAVGVRNSLGEIPVVVDSGTGAGPFSLRGSLTATSTDFNPERIILDDVVSGVTTPSVKVGDQSPNPIVGVIDYSLGNFKVYPEVSPTFTPGSLAAESIASPASSRLAVATLDLNGLVPSDSRLTTIAQRIVNSLSSPDLIALQEVADSSGATDNGVVSASTTYAELQSAIVTAGGPSYEVRQVDPANNQDGAAGLNLRNAFLYRTDRGLAFASGQGVQGDATTATAVTQDGFGAPHLSLNPGRVVPANTAFNSTRKSVAAEFTYGDRSLFVVDNRFISRTGDDPLFGRYQPPTAASRAQRVQQAQAVNAFVKQLLTVDPQARVLVLGNLNDNQFTQTLTALKDQALTNLTDTLTEVERYTVNVDGNAQAFDHQLVTSGLSGLVTSYDIVHTDSEFTSAPLQNDPTVAIIKRTFGLTVSKSGTGSGTVTSSPVGIDCGATCSANFDDATPVTLSAAISAGSIFTGWSGSGCSGTGTCQVTMSQARSVTANFTPITFGLTVSKSGAGSGTVTSSPTGIDCGATCSANFNEGTPVTLSAAAAAGSTFTGWSGSGCSGTGTCQVTMSEARSVTANFDPVAPPGTFGLTVSKSGTGSGTVTSSPTGIDCGGTCSANFNEGTLVTLSAAAAAGSTFTGWSGSDCSGTGTCQVTMSEARSVTASFALQQLSIPSTATLTYSRLKKRFKAKVATPLMTSCRSGRKVKLKRVRRGPDAIVKTSTTDGNGIAKMGLRNPEGKYYVVVKGRTFTTDEGTTVTCKRTRSTNLTLR